MDFLFGLGIGVSFLWISTLWGYSVLRLFLSCLALYSIFAIAHGTVPLSSILFSPQSVDGLLRPPRDYSPRPFVLFLKMLQMLSTATISARLTDLSHHGVGAGERTRSSIDQHLEHFERVSRPLERPAISVSPVAVL
jgi:hypothetical protein